MPLLAPDFSSWTSLGGGGTPPVTLVPSYWNPGGIGDRTSSITVTTTATLGGGTIDNLVDGGYGSNSTDGCWFNNGQTLREVKFDFGVQKIINGFRWSQGTTGHHGTWVLEGSNDDSTYTGIGSSFLLGLAGSLVAFYEFTNTTAYRYYKLRQISGSTNSGPWLREIEFRIAATGDATSRDAAETGDRTASITTSTTATLGGGTINNLIDGVIDLNTTDACFFNSGQSTREIKFDFGSGKIITGFTWLQDTDNSHGTWVLEGSNDDSSYTGVGSSFTLGGLCVETVTFSNSTSYRYYKLRQTSGTTSSTPWLMEIEFRLG
ncbi:MAG: hypothetical protein E5V62_02955 [Mesorhizobium sp.]|uniref:hypothetical protein n=1 Tax=Mesorhizobium sp. TaxID=1871066 RepID=UPI000FD3824A|nr:hypothetical protein [Mesorhizobium sp.]RVD68614.1 hypothetical protein EN751_30460 [Mesorhizobium sp. M4A.F.Ca.ET.029.04.2.1]TIW37124.1 MAG: hypothetical protein E5V62_02955 [Mesorhizobium sp.]